VTVLSMTGFGKGEVANSSFNLTIEIKSVNHRFKDLRFKMSSLFNSIELELREALSKEFKRGSFDIYINYKKIENTKNILEIDFKKVNEFLSIFNKEVDIETGLLNVRPIDFLRSEFHIEQDENIKVNLKKLAKDAFELALIELKGSRLNEGAKMEIVLSNHLENFLSHFKTIVDIVPGFQTKIKEKLIKKFDEYKSEMNIDEPRFLQEVVYYMEKSDIQEEIDRIRGHVENLRDLLKKGGEVGRHIDFFIQELNREVNTIGSKATDEEISNAVVNMKSHLEKIREQGLNIE